MKIEEAKSNFDSHVGAAISLIEYFVLIATTFPQLLTRISFDEEVFQESVKPWCDFISRLHGRDVYSKPPDPIYFEGKDIPENELSDQIYMALGKNHPLFDAVHAPFTRPLDTQIALISINYTWDAYDTLIKIVLREFEGNKSIKGVSTDQRLASCGLLHSLGTDWDEELVAAGKLLRSAFAHHFGMISSSEIKRAEKLSIDGFKLLDSNGRFECSLGLSKRTVETIQKKAAHVFRKALSMGQSGRRGR